MITDSPYDFRDLPLTPSVGAGAGMVAAGIMLGVMFLLQPLSGVRLASLLSQIGHLLLLGRLGDSSAMLTPMLGAGFHFFFGMSFGLLYAACQQTAPARGLIAVGLFYGLLLWIFGGVIVASILDSSLRTLMRNWSWLIAHEAYGLSLAGAAIWSQRRMARAEEVLVPID